MVLMAYIVRCHFYRELLVVSRPIIGSDESCEINRSSDDMISTEGSGWFQVEIDRG
jgi:hypothetical protein